MSQIAIIIFRESLEISILIGVLLANTKAIKGSKILIICGAVLGLTLATILAFFTKSLSNSLDDTSQELIDVSIMLITAALISWTVIWMQGYTQRIKESINKLSNKGSTDQVGQLQQRVPSGLMLVSIVATIFCREGSEIILFTYSAYLAHTAETSDFLQGIALGLLLGTLIGFVIYKGLIKFTGRYVFKISNALLILIAASLTSKAAVILTSSGIVRLMSWTVWDTSAIINNASQTGKILNAITGYDANPNALQLSFYFGTILLNIGMIYFRTNTIYKK